MRFFPEKFLLIIRKANPGLAAIILPSIMLLCSCTASKRPYGNYFNKYRYWGPMFVLKPDSTFEYTNCTNAGKVTTTHSSPTGQYTKTDFNYFFSDSSYGKYSFMGDTILLTYFTAEVQGDFNWHNIRPKRLLWEGRRLYYIIASTGTVIRHKELYMQKHKGRVANSYRPHEQMTQEDKSRDRKKKHTIH